MINYGYSTGNDIDPTKIITPSKLDKIHLTPFKPKFIVVGTRDSIFDWMELYGEVHVFDQEFHPHSKPFTNRHNHSKMNEFKIISTKDPNPTITFGLYSEEEEHHHNILSIFRPKKYRGSSKMRLEINISPPSTPTSEPVKPVLKCGSGVKLQEVLERWNDLYKFKNSDERRKQLVKDFES